MATTTAGCGRACRGTYRYIRRLVGLGPKPVTSVRADAGGARAAGAAAARAGAARPTRGRDRTAMMVRLTRRFMSRPFQERHGSFGDITGILYRISSMSVRNCRSYRVA